MRRSDLSRAGVVALAIALGGCSLAPALKVPDVPIAEAYKEQAPWTAAQPADELPRDAWWTLYGDAQLFHGAGVLPLFERDDPALQHGCVKRRCIRHRRLEHGVT